MKLLIKSRSNHMKMQRPVISVKKNLKINMREIKYIVKLEIIFIIQENMENLRIAYAI